MNVANLFTLLRLVLAPFAYSVGLFGEAWVFGVIYGVGVFTDAIDGSVARLRKEGSKWGSTLDTIADVAFFPSSLCVFRFFPVLTAVEAVLLGVILILLVILLVMMASYRAWSLPHLMSTKAATGILNVFVLVTVFAQFYAWLFYLMLAAWCVAAGNKMVQMVRA